MFEPVLVFVEWHFLAPANWCRCFHSNVSALRRFSVYVFMWLFFCADMFCYRFCVAYIFLRRRNLQDVLASKCLKLKYLGAWVFLLRRSNFFHSRRKSLDRDWLRFTEYLGFCTKQFFEVEVPYCKQVWFLIFLTSNIFTDKLLKITHWQRFSIVGVTYWYSYALDKSLKRDGHLTFVEMCE